MAETNVELLKKFKLTIGDLSPSKDLDDYYNNFLESATASLLANDISEDVLKTELGATTIVLYAIVLMRGEDAATNPTLILLRNTLAVQTKGLRYDNGS